MAPAAGFSAGAGVFSGASDEVVPLLFLLLPLWVGYQAGASARFWCALFNHPKHKFFVRMSLASEWSFHLSLFCGKTDKSIVKNRTVGKKQGSSSARHFSKKYH